MLIVLSDVKAYYATNVIFFNMFEKEVKIVFMMM